MKKVLSLLEPDEPDAVEVMNPEGTSRTLLVCDHATNRLPRSLGNLGLSSLQLADHIAWDPGAAAVARLLSDALNAPLVLSGYSRLAVDCNRPLQSTESIAEQTGGIKVPGNQHLSQEERAQRINALFHPYHQAIEHLLNKRLEKTHRIISIHSFTPVLQGQERPWHIGISSRREPRLAELLYAALSEARDICVGYNQPYPIEDEFDYTLPQHGEQRGLQSVMIEIRQDGIKQQEGPKQNEGIVHWVNKLIKAIHRAELELDRA